MQRRRNPSPRLFLDRKRQKGMVLVYSVIFIMAALGLSAFAVDLAHAFAVSNELKAIADAGALTAAAGFFTEMRVAADSGEDLNAPEIIEKIMAKTQTTCKAVMARSKIISRVSDVTVTLELGRYDTNSSEPYDERTGSLFTDMTEALRTGTVSLRDISAFRVTVERKGAAALRTFFAKIFRFSSFSFARNSVSVLAPRNFMLVIDSSGSMDDISYPRTTSLDPVTKIVAQPATLWPAAESFISRPTLDASFPILFSPLAPAPNPPLYPEPLQTVLNSSLEFLNGLVTQTDLGDKAGIYYFGAHASSKIPGQDPMVAVTADNVDNVFKPILSNSELYQNLRPGTVPLLLPNGNTVTDPYDIYTGNSAYNPALEQFDGPIAIPQGNTNIGDAIISAANAISVSSTSGKSISVIVLFTDGMPDCAPSGGAVQCFGTGATAGQLEASRNYVLQQAQVAIQNNIRIYPITYGNFGGGVEATRTQLLFDTIAQLSGLTAHFHIPDTNDIATIHVQLQKIFDEISLFVPFALAG